MPCQIYICPPVGDGLTPETAFRPLVVDFIDRPAGDKANWMDCPGRNFYICYVDSSDGALDAIEAEGQSTKVLPLRATDTAHLRQILDAPFSAYPLAWSNAARTFLESHGIDTDWITGTHTMRDVLRKIVRHIASVQTANGQGQSGVVEFIQENLDMVIGNIPVEKRNAIGNWLDAKGIDTSGITLSSTVRDVMKLLSPNFALLYGRDVPLRFAGEDM